MDPNSLLTIPEQIVRKLRKEIHSGKFATGEALREVQLAERFGVSRGPVRHAMFQLTKEGLLESKPNVGVKVAQKPGPEVYKLIVSMRLELELFVLHRIGNRLSDFDYDVLDTILENLKKACLENDVDTVFEYDFYFHEFLIKKFGDDHILDLWRSIISRMMMQYSCLEELMDSYKEHKDILDAIRSGKTEVLEDLLRLNIQ